MIHNVIIYCVKARMISSSTNGSDDGFILCLKPGGVAHNAVEAIVTDTVHLNSRDDGVDPFVSDSVVEFELDLHVGGTGGSLYDE